MAETNIEGQHRRASFTERAFRPYAIGIGQTVLAWNDLQETLGRLFSRIMDSDWYVIRRGDEVFVTSKALEAWQSLKMDRPKRDLLTAALGMSHPQEKKKFPKMLADLTWTINQTNSLEDTRNDAIHAPLRLFHSEKEGARIPAIEAAKLFGNRRAKKLSKKDILAEFRWCRDVALTLRNFADELDRSLADPQRPWPQRPKMPTRRQTKTKTQPRRPTPPE
jgi:hypothetical protein